MVPKIQEQPGAWWRISGESVIQYSREPGDPDLSRPE